MNAGIVTVAGQSYIERFQVFPIWLQGVASNALLQNQRVALPGQYMFRLKTLARDVLVLTNGVYVRASRPFLFRLGSASDASWYTGGAVSLNTSGNATDRVLDTNMFGTGQFPKAVVPDILYPAGGQITFEVQDVSQNGPYDIHFAFEGSYLVPVSNGSVVGANS